MRAGKALAIAALALYGCSNPIVHEECYGPGSPAFTVIEPIDLSGTWNGMVRDAISLRFDLHQVHALTEPGQDARLEGTVSITIPGPVEARASLTGSTRATPNCDESRIRLQSLRVFAELAVTTTDRFELDLLVDLTGAVESGEVAGTLQYAGPTAIVFDAEGNVVSFELDRFSDSSFKLTRS